MKYTDEYRDPVAAKRLIESIRVSAREPIQIMEFCGGHTHAIMRYGIRAALAPHVRMLSGPGCPVCVTDDSDIDNAITLSLLPGVTVATFGDMVRVPGSQMSLQEARAVGGDVRIVYSALDALALAQKEPDRAVVFLGIGFETTAPTVAATLMQAESLGVRNFTVYSMHKTTPPAMRAILDAGQVRVDAVLGPGHVSSITGWQAWNFLPDSYGIPCAVSGFEPLDILHAIHLLVTSDPKKVGVSNAYARGTTQTGNLVAQELLERVFEIRPTHWRGLGEIPNSGLEIRKEWAHLDAQRTFDLASAPTTEPGNRHKGCRCGDVLRGVISPTECPLFGKACTPVRPVGPCMVSGEGACAAYYRYGGEID